MGVYQMSRIISKELREELKKYRDGYLNGIEIGTTVPRQTDVDYDMHSYLIQCDANDADKVLAKIPDTLDDEIKENINEYLRLTSERLRTMADGINRVAGQLFLGKRFGIFERRRYLKADAEYADMIFSLDEIIIIIYKLRIRR